MASGGSANSNFVALKTDNYPTWRIQCKMTLYKEGLWGIVSREEERPGDRATPEQRNKFQKRWEKALSLIVLSIDPSLLYLIGDPTSPIDTWELLENQFQKRTWANKLHLRRKLYSMKLIEGGAVQEHVRNMTEVFNALSAVGDAVTDEDRVIHLLASLPESFDVLVTALEACPEVPTMDVVVDRLFHEERKLGRDDGERAMTVRRQKGKGPMCYNCKEFGHVKKDCPSFKGRKPESKPRSKKKHRVNNACSKEDSDSDNQAGLTVSHAMTLDASLQNKWIIDSGATCHMCNDKSKFSDLQVLGEMQQVILGDGNSLKAVGKGSVMLELLAGRKKNCLLKDVLYVPGLNYNLLSVPKSTEIVDEAVFGHSKCEFLKHGKIVATGKRVGELYYLECGGGAPVAAVAQGSEVSPELWHRRYGHIGEQSLRKLAKENLVDGFSYDNTKEVGFCEGCAEGKNHKKKFPAEASRRSDEVLGLVHSDVCGKMSEKSLSGSEYFLTFIDDKTRFTWIYFLKTKDEVFDKFLEWKKAVEKSSGKELKTLRTDNGGEYTSRKFEEYLKKEGIRHELTIPKTPEQNGVAERSNRTLVEMARSMLCGMSRKFWAEAISTAVYLRNRSPTAALENMTPYEALMGEKPNVAHLRVFGSTCYAHVPKDERKKLDSKSRKCLFLGYGDCVKGYRVFDITRSRVIFSRDVLFDECKLVQKPGDVTEPIEEPTKVTAPEDSQISDSDDEALMQEMNEQEEQFEPEDVPGGRPVRERRPPEMYGEWVNLTKDQREPTTVKEALGSSNKEKWQEAMEREMTSLFENDVWDLVDLPTGRKTIGSKWVFKEKLGPDGQTERLKARLVAQGYTQRYGQDYDETFSPVVRPESIRTIIALAARDDLMLHQMDVTTAFLNGTLEEDVFMKQPEGFVVKGKEEKVCKLKKSIYGLKQSPRCWNVTLHSRLTEIGFTQSKSDPCIYHANDGKEILAVYVDDIIIAAKDGKRMEKIKQAIAEKFSVKDMGKLKYFLGVSVNQTDSDISLNQSGYVTRLLDRFNMQEAKPVATPVDVSSKLTKTLDSEQFDQVLYQSAVGSLLYVSIWTRPDVTYAVANVAKFCASPTKEHWTAVKRIMRYLKGTINFGLCYERGNKAKCVGYSDSDWGSDVDDRKSISGYLFQIGGTAISWRSKKQASVALSTAEAEYMALASTAQEAVWLQQLMCDLARRVNCVQIYEDNQAAIKMSKNPQFHGRCKHIEIKYHFIRELVANKQLVLHYCPTEEMVADMLTKGLCRDQFNKLRNMAGVKELGANGN